MLPPLGGGRPEVIAAYLGRPPPKGGSMATLEKLSARGVYDPPGYSQAIKVTGAQTILFLAGQVAYDKDGGAAHPGDFKAQARQVFSSVKALVEAGGGTLANSSTAGASSPFLASWTPTRMSASMRHWPTTP